MTVAGEAGNQLFVFDAQGRHLQTVETNTGAVLYEFTYDSAGLLATVADRDNNVTIIERNSLDEPTAIVGPYGQRTELTLDANGYLETVTGYFSPLGPSTTNLPNRGR